MEPASSIIKKLGGPAKVARIVGVHRTRVSNWMRSKAVGGTGGTIPQKRWATLIGAAQAQGIDLTFMDFAQVEVA